MEMSERLAADGHEVTVFTTDAIDIQHYWLPGKEKIDVRHEVHNGVDVRPLQGRSASQAPPGPAGARQDPGLLPEEPVLFPFPAGPGDARKDLDAAEVRHRARDGAALRLNPLHRVPHREETGHTAGALAFLPPRGGGKRRRKALLHETSPDEAGQERRQGPRADGHRAGLPGGKRFSSGADDACWAWVSTPGSSRAATERASGRSTIIIGPIVCYIGPKTYDKGTFHLVQAMESLWRGGDPSTLVLAGTDIEDFRRYHEKLPEKVKSKCLMLDFISEEDKRDLLDACDLLVASLALGLVRHRVPGGVVLRQAGGRRESRRHTGAGEGWRRRTAGAVRGRQGSSRYR